MQRGARMKEVLYGLNSQVIAGVLLGSMLLAIVLGHRVGRRTASAPDAPARDHVNAIQSSLLVVLIVVLAFLVVDLDRPRRGLIRVDQASLLNLKAGIDADLAQGAAAAGASPLPRPAVTGRP